MILLYDRKRAYILIIIIISIITLTFSLSYAFNREESDIVYTVNKEDLTITYDSNSNNVITPLELIEDLNTLPSYNFTIKNISNEEIYYNIILNINSDIDPNLLPYIMVQIDNDRATYLNSNKTNDGYNIYLGNLNSRVANTHQLKIWLNNKDKIGNELLSIEKIDIDFTIDAIISNYTPSFKTNLENLVATSNELFKDEHGNIRYYGINPNNYVKFNNELWRVIGINKTSTENGEKNLIKIIRSEALVQTSIDYKSNNNYSNNYKESSLIKILNNNGYWNRTIVECPNTKERKASCDFTTSGLLEESKKLIEKINYYQGGWHVNTISPASIYLKEKVVRQADQTAHVVLMSPSDYGYASGPMYQNVYLDSFDKSAKSYNWLAIEQEEWLFAPNAENYKKGFSVEKNGLVILKDNVTNPKVIRPVVFLKEELILVSGTGTSENPYQIELDTDK